MTAERLRSMTRKHLATMARRRDLPGWHEMKKDELVHALLADDRERIREIQDGRVETDPIDSTTSESLDEARIAEDQLTIAAVSPEWMRAEWSIAKSSFCRVKAAIGQQSRAATPILRLYEITDDECQTHGRTRVCDTEISFEAREWFVRVDVPGRVYRLQLGMRAHDGEFFGICSSNLVEMPHTDTSVTAHNRQNRQPSREIPGRRSLDHNEVDVRFEIDADVTLRGRAHPQAVVTISGEQIQLRADGTFDWPCQITDGRHILPAVCTSVDGRREQTVVLAFERNTKRLAPKDGHES